MRELYQNVIEKYRSNTAKIESNFNKLWDIHNFYRIRRPDYIGNTMLICSFIPFFVFILGFTVFTISKNLNPMMLRGIMLGIVAFCSFVIAPIVLWHIRNKFKEFNPRLKGKSKVEIIADDFKNYLERLSLSVQVEINSKVTNHFEAELKNLNDKEALIESLKGEYNIISKNAVSLNNNSDKNLEIKQLSDLKQVYQEKLNQEIKKLAVVKFFDFSFKRDWMTMSMNGMMGAMLSMMVWNLPMFMTLSKPQISNSNDWLFELCVSILLPLVIGFTAPFFWNFYNRKRMHKSFGFVTNELEVQVDTNKYSSDVKADVEGKITELEDKIALTVSKLEILVSS